MNWKTKKVGEICQSIVPGRNKPKVFDGNIPWVNTPDITSRYIPDKAHSIFISTEELKSCGGKIVPSGSVIMTCVGDLGIVAINNREIVINQQLHAFVCNEEILNEFLAYALEVKKDYMRSVASHTTIPYLNKSNCESIPVSFPKIQEQKEIVRILGGWDSLIQKTEELIATKQKQFNWLQGNLILQNRNNKSWKNLDLSKISIVKKGEQLNRSTLSETGEYAAWNGGITPSGYTNKWNVEGNTITISEGGNSCGFVNFCEQNFWCGGHCYALLNINESIDKKYLFYFLKSHQQKIMKLRVGSGLPNIQKSSIDQFNIYFPEINLQKKIGKALDANSKEIQLLQNLAEKYRLQKRGLMQKLLTGKWRVK